MISGMRSAKNWTPYLPLACLVFLFLNVSLWGIDRPSYKYFDEEHYVEAGQELVMSGVNRNWSHPPFAKTIIGVGTQLFGNTPLGWRVMSALFGSAVIALIYAWAMVLFRDRKLAMLVAILTAVNQMHFVQSRIATLDVFMVCFILLGFVYFTRVYLQQIDRNTRRGWVALLVSGFGFGLALACKWLAIVPAVFCAVLLFLQMNTTPLRLRLRLSIGPFIVLPVLVYLFVSSLLVGLGHPDYAPILDSKLGPSQPIFEASTTYGLLDILKLQFEMLKTHVSFSNPGHPYVSSWYTWPLMLRPMWYHFVRYDMNGVTELSGIFLIGNPIVFWLGLLAIGHCIWLGYKKKDPVAKLIAGAFLVLWLCWAVLPRKTGFFYYYYPSSMMLGLALVLSAKELQPPKWVLYGGLVLAILSFVFFYPVMTAKLMPIESFQWRILFNQWL
jgi:dolichyl-phosphate-mannose-protein mannosyltransferase